MIIKTVDGVAIDTDKLSDIRALLLEKAEELRKLCCDNNYQLLILLDQKAKVSPIIWNYCNQDLPSQGIDTDKPAVINEGFIKSYNAFFDMVNFGVYNLSKGTIQLSKAQNPDDHNSQ